MEDDLIFIKKERRPQFFQNGRQPQFFVMEDALIFFQKWRTTSIFSKKEDDLKFGKWKTTSILIFWQHQYLCQFWQREDKLNILTNGRRLNFFLYEMRPQISNV